MRFTPASSRSIPSGGSMSRWATSATRCSSRSAELPRAGSRSSARASPLNRKDVEADWVLNWHSVLTSGETIVGPPPRELGPEVTAEALRRAIERQLDGWKDDVREPWVAYVPARQGYIVVTVCRALYGLATGELTTKENAVAWAAERFPDRADFITEALKRYRADPTEPHRATIEFVDFALTDADRLEECPARAAFRR